MSRMKMFIALTVIAGYFSVLILYGLGEIRFDTDNQAMLILVGGLAGAFGMIVSWYFGSSEGSSRKTDAIISSQKREEVQ